jgi:streptogramin lyase
MPFAAPASPPVALTARLPAAVAVATPFAVRFRAAGKPVVIVSGPVTATFAARRTAPGRYVATVRLAQAGRWTIAVRARGRRYRLGVVSARRPPAQPVFFAQPASIAARPDGTLVLAEAAANRIVNVDPSAGTVTPLATGLANPYGVAVAPSGDVYATASDTLVRIDASGRVTPVATVADLGPVTVGPDGSVYVSTSTDVFRVDPATGTSAHVAGTGVRGGAGDGGPAATAQINHPHALLVASDGALLVPDTDNHRVRRIDPVTGVITTIAAGIAGVSGICAGGGATYVTDFTGMTLLRLDASGPAVVAGNGAQASSGDGRAATQASLDVPLSCAVAGGQVYVVEAGGTGTVRVVSPGGGIATLSRR